MHIPTCETNQLELVRFEPALEAANRPSPDYDVGRWLYVPNFYSEYRYILGTRGEKPLICIGINPSTAAPDDLDNTLKSVERVALHNGYDSFIMFNVYAPIRTTWSLPATQRSIVRTWRPSTTSSPWTRPGRPRSGPPGAPSLKSGTICPAVSGT